LFEKIKKTGYKLQSELPEMQGTSEQYYDEVTVSIGSDGKLVFEDGRHRLSIAKVLGLPEIPVIVATRHKKWQSFKVEIRAAARIEGGKVYAPLTHPDLRNIPSIHGHDRYDLIASRLPCHGSTFLDIGAQWGYFCHRFEEAGMECYAVEIDEENLYFLEKLKKAEGRSFTIVPKSIFEYDERREFDVVLALNIFHHFIKSETTYVQLGMLLRSLKMRYMVFEAHDPNEPQMMGAYHNYPPDEFVQFLQDNSCLRKAEHIGNAKDGRKLFLLSA